MWFFKYFKRNEEENKIEEVIEEEKEQLTEDEIYIQYLCSAFNLLSCDVSEPVVQILKLMRDNPDRFQTLDENILVDTWNNVKYDFCYIDYNGGCWIRNHDWMTRSECGLIYKYYHHVILPKREELRKQNAREEMMNMYGITNKFD